MPNFLKYHLSLTNELYAIESRIKDLVKHNLTSGEHRESALRTMLRRHVPPNYIVGRGFVVSPNGSTGQIDILVVDGDTPCLYKDGDLMIVTPDAVRAIVEVKTTTSVTTTSEDADTKITTELKELAAKGQFCDEVLREMNIDRSVWTGFFVFNDVSEPESGIMEALKQARQETGHAVNCIGYGPSKLVRYWSEAELAAGAVGAEFGGKAQWNYYELPKPVAPTYFIGNVLDQICVVDQPAISKTWFPLEGGKEQSRVLSMSDGDFQQIDHRQ